MEFIWLVHKYVKCICIMLLRLRLLKDLTNTLFSRDYMSYKQCINCSKCPHCETVPVHGACIHPDGNLKAIVDSGANTVQPTV